MDKSAHGLAVIGALECLAALVFVLAPATGDGDAPPNYNTVILEPKDSKSRISSENVDGILTINGGRAEPLAGLSICADVNAGFICAP